MISSYSRYLLISKCLNRRTRLCNLHRLSRCIPDRKSRQKNSQKKNNRMKRYMNFSCHTFLYPNRFYYHRNFKKRICHSQRKSPTHFLFPRSISSVVSTNAESAFLSCQLSVKVHNTEYFLLWIDT